MKKKIFNIIQIGDKSNRISRAFDFLFLQDRCLLLLPVH